MKLLKIEKRIDILETICEQFLSQVDDNSINKIENMSLKVKAFDEIVAECKEEIESSSIEHKIHILKLLYGLEIDENNMAILDESLDDYVNSQINNLHMKVNERKINILKNIISSITSIIEELVVDYKITLNLNLSWYRFQGKKLNKQREFLTRLVNLKEKLESELENDSQKISFIIIENFYNLYIFFSFLISLLVYEKREILLIEIANRLDRYIEVIEPSFSDRFLHYDDMIYHYALYEIRELKNKIFTELALQ